jgi:hypothetical protein
MFTASMNANSRVNAVSPEYFYSYVYCNNTEIFNLSNRLNNSIDFGANIGSNYELYYDQPTLPGTNYNICANPYCKEICANNVSSTMRSGVKSLSLNGDKPSCVCYYAVINYD